uniref:Uncharacterized protein n=1 Tax=Anguilla anguilla TaxID=7936 RepID=A0A0E9PYS3_ANGAN
MFNLFPCIFSEEFIRSYKMTKILTFHKIRDET